MLKDFETEKWNGKKIAIYGAGEDGKIIADGLQKQGVQNFIFCDSYKNNKRLLDRMVFPIDVLEKEKDINIIIGSSRYCLEIYKKLKAMGIKDEDIYTAKKICSSNIHKFSTHDLYEVSGHYRYENSFLKLDAYMDNGWYLEHLDITVTERCTLNCNACCSLIPLYKTPKNCECDVMFEAFDNLLRSKCYIGTVNLMGGEPLVNQDLIQKLLLRYKRERQIGSFQIISNGTIVPNKKTLSAMKENGRFYMIFSNYEGLSNEQERAVKLLREYEIESAIVSDQDISAGNNTLWIDYGKVRHYNFPREKHQKMFENCKDGKFCTTLLNGKLFVCTRIAHGVNLGLIPESLERCSVNLLNDAIKDREWTEIKKDCINLLCHKEYPPACEYCNRDAGILVERAKQIDKTSSRR